jgi:hypothetical protein
MTWRNPVEGLATIRQHADAWIEAHPIAAAVVIAAWQIACYATGTALGLFLVNALGAAS